jgi:hypothetical protein
MFQHIKEPIQMSSKNRKLFHNFERTTTSGRKKFEENMKSLKIDIS